MKRFTGYFRSRDIFFLGSKDVPYVNSLHSFTCCVLAYLCKRFRKCENFLSFTSLPTEIFELPGTGHNCYSSQHMFTTAQSYIHRIVDIIHIPPLSILSMDSVFLFSHLHFPIPTSTAPTIPHPPKTPNRTPVPTFISANPLDRPMLAVRRKKMVTLSSTKADTKAMVNTQKLSNHSVPFPKLGYEQLEPSTPYRIKVAEVEATTSLFLPLRSPFAVCSPKLSTKHYPLHASPPLPSFRQSPHPGSPFTLYTQPLVPLHLTEMPGNPRCLATPDAPMRAMPGNPRCLVLPDAPT